MPPQSCIHNISFDEACVKCDLASIHDDELGNCLCSMIILPPEETCRVCSQKIELKRYT